MWIDWICGSPNSAVAATTQRFCEHAATVMGLPSTLRFRIATSLEGGWGATVLGGRYNGTVLIAESLAAHEVLPILAHELIHINQLHRGDLVGLPSGGVLWLGTLYTDIDRLDYVQYRALPWEAEAFERQDWLLKTVVNNGIRNL